MAAETNEYGNQTSGYFLKGEKLHATHCIWCGEPGPLTDSHLFPESLGGAFAPKTTCQECNSFLGHRIESQVKKNAFLTAAIAKLGLSGRAEAYRHGRHVDTTTGLEVRRTEEGYVKPVSKPIGNGQFIGSEEEMKAYAVAQLRRKRPNWPIDPLVEFYDDPTRSKLTYAGIIFTKQILPGGPSEIRIEGLSRDPHDTLIFKVVFEFLSLCRLADHPLFRAAVLDPVTIDTGDTKNRIVLSSDLRWRTLSNTGNTFREYRELEEIPFHPFHTATMRLSENLHLFVEITFFGQLRNFYIIGSMMEWDDSIMCLIDQCFIFPLGENMPRGRMYRHLVNPIGTQWVNASVDLRVWEHENGKE